MQRQQKLLESVLKKPRITRKLDKLSANSKRNIIREYAEQETSDRITGLLIPSGARDITSGNLNNRAKKISLIT
jgi:hypothetical protein